MSTKERGTRENENKNENHTFLQDANEGSQFDPSKRTFTEDELKPQPIIRKSKKTHVPADSKVCF